jgi:hypothetical protein
MASTNPLSAERLYEMIHTALSLWHKSSADGDPLAELVLYQQVRARHDSVRSATNQLLSDLIAELSEHAEEDAKILRLRYAENLSAQNVAQRLNMSDGNVFKRQREAIEHLAQIVLDHETSLRARSQERFQSVLPAATYSVLFGVVQAIAALTGILTQMEAPWLISLEGIGGIGKTSLAHALTTSLISEGVIGWQRYSRMAWVTARRQQINIGGALHDFHQPALPAEELVIELADQLLQPEERRDLPAKALEAKVRRQLKQSPHLVVIDNLETDADIHVLRDLLYGLSNPSRFLVTSRRSLYDQIGFFPFRLPELSREESLSLLRHEARLRNLPDLSAAPDAQLDAVYQTVGGNPLALRLVAGLTYVHSLDHVLADLTAARGQAIEQLYTHIYRSAWERLNEDERHLLLVMPLVNENGAEADLIAEIAEQPAPELRPILERLVALNLVESRGDLHRRCYTIHSLTRSFLHEQVLRWSTRPRHEQPKKH